jgi:hypothetical protein
LLPSNAIAEAGDSDGRAFKVASIQDSDLPADVVFGHLGGACFGCRPPQGLPLNGTSPA